MRIGQNDKRVGRWRVRPIGSGRVVAESRLDQFRVVVLRKPDGEFTYDVLIESEPTCWWAIMCMSRQDERVYPKRAAKLGTLMVRKAKEGAVSA